MPFACIFVPDFSAEAVVRASPELRGKPVAILEGNPPLQKICAANEQARNAGIIAGMTKLQAELCDDVISRERSELQESVAHRALLDCAQSFSPRMEDAAADTVLLDLSGLEKLFGPLPGIARTIHRRTGEFGLNANVAAGPTLESVLLAAHGFCGVSIIPEEKTTEFLGRLPVDLLFADAGSPEELEMEELEILETLKRWGVRKCIDLIALPELELSERLGQRGLELHRKARGIGERVLAPSDPPLIFEEATELDFPLVLMEPLAFLLGRMLGQLCARLQARALAAQELCLELTLENFHQVSDSRSVPFRRTIHLPVPMLDSGTFLKLLQLDLKSHPPGAPMVKVCLRIEPAKPRHAQNELFLPSSPEPEKLELTLARICSLVGEGRAGSPALLDTYRRDAFEMQHFNPSLQKRDTPGDSINLVTALRIFRPAVKVIVTHEGGKPVRITRQKLQGDGARQIQGNVLWSAGPWRSSGDWWEEDAWVRDEWDIAVQKQCGIAMYRLMHDLVTGEWMVEGSYD
jgi:protein ImuB